MAIQKKTKWLTMVGVLLTLSSCQSSPSVTKAYVEGMDYQEANRRESEPYAALSYDIIGGDEAMPIGGVNDRGYAAGATLVRKINESERKRLEAARKMALEQYEQVAAEEAAKTGQKIDMTNSFQLK